MNKLFISLTVLIVLFTSCQKELSIESGGNNNVVNSNALLVKSVTKTSNDSIITLYNYDASQKLISFNTTGITNGFTINSDYKIIRNSSGIILKTVQTDLTLNDSIVRTIYYNANLKRYISATQLIDLGGQIFTDSTTYIHDSNGRIVEEDDFLSQLGLSLIIGKALFSYNSQGNNIISAQIFADTAITATLTEIATVHYTFDSKNRPISLNKNNDAFAAGLEEQFNTNNALTFQFNNLTSPSNSYSLTSTYSYNSLNYPVSATVIQNPGNLTTATTYYYQ